MKAVVMAYHEMGVIGLEAVLRHGFSVPLVVTHPDDPREERWFRSVRELAERHAIPVLELEEPGVPAHVARIAAAGPDAIFSFYFRKMIGPEILELAADGAFNLHGSLLPRYRGRAPINWVLVNGETETGVTLHVMDVRPDHGEIVGQRRVPIGRDDTALTLYGKLAEAARAVLDEALPQIRERCAPKLAQDHRRSSYFGGRKPEDGRIRWEWPAERVRNLVRAVTRPWPGAFTTVRGRRLIVWAAETGAGFASLAPGQLVEAGGSLAVVTGEGFLHPRDVQLEGRAAASWDDAVRELELLAGDRIGEERA